MRKILPLVWLAAIALMAALGGQLQGESTHFLGIADDSEQVIRFAYPVEIEAVLVAEAAEVTAGTELLKVRRPDLTARLMQIDDQIRTATAVNEGGAGDLSAKLKEKIAERAARLAELDAKIQALRSRRALNQKMLYDISGKRGAETDSSPFTAELDGLVEQRRHMDSALNEEIDGLRARLGRSANPFATELAELQDRKAELKRQQNDLSVRASVVGRVGSINVRAGEQVAPFKSILTVNGESPHFVKGYISETVYNEVAVGQTVWIEPSRPTRDGAAIRAEVESLGSRIVEYPQRLTKNPQVPAWGREVVIRLPEGSTLLMGEKVLVNMRSPDQRSWIARLYAALTAHAQAATLTGRPSETSSSPQPIHSRIDGLDSVLIEPSGIVAMPGRDRFLVISDEAQDGRAQILTMNSTGEIIGSKPVLGDRPIDDIESIGWDGEDLYISASLSFNRRGQRHAKRCQLMRLRDTSAGYEPIAALDLCRTLEQLAKTSDDPDTRQFLSAAIAKRTINVEALAVRDNRLYLGFKAPFDSEGQTVILALPQLGKLLDGAAPQGRIWQRLALKDPAGGQSATLSDMVLRDRELLLLAISGQGKDSVSHLWSLNLKDDPQLRLLATAGGRAEGVSDRLVDGRLLLVFDGGGISQPQYLPVAVDIAKD